MAFELVVDVLKVFAHRSNTYSTNPGNLLSAESLGDKCEHVELPSGELRSPTSLLSKIVLELDRRGRVIDPIENCQHGLQASCHRHIGLGEVNYGSVDRPGMSSGRPKERHWDR